MKNFFYILLLFVLCACGRNFEAQNTSADAAIPAGVSSAPASLSKAELDALKVEYSAALPLHQDHTGEKWTLLTSFTSELFQPGTVIDPKNGVEDVVTLKDQVSFEIELGQSVKLPNLQTADWQTPITIKLPCGQFTGSYQSLQSDLNLDLLIDYKLEMQTSLPETCSGLPADHEINKFLYWVRGGITLKSSQHVFLTVFNQVFVFTKTGAGP